MPMSMRKQAHKRKKRAKQLQEQSSNRQMAVALLRQPQSLRSIHRQTTVPVATIHRMKMLIESGNMDKLQLMLSDTITPGRKPVISDAEGALINERLKLAAQRGITVDRDSFRHILSRVSADGRNGWKNGITHDDSIRA